MIADQPEQELTMIERIFFSLAFTLWMMAVAFEVIEQPHNVRLFLLCMKYTYRGLLRIVGLY